MKWASQLQVGANLPAPTLDPLVIDFNSESAGIGSPNAQNDIVFGRATTTTTARSNTEVLALTILHVRCSFGTVTPIGVCVNDTFDVFEWDQLYNLPKIIDGSIILNILLTQTQFDIVTIMVHEMGHVLNMGHVNAIDCPGDVMKPTLGSGEVNRDLGPNIKACVQIAFDSVSSVANSNVDLRYVWMGVFALLCSF